jgi:hypothetical protein
MPFLQRDGEVTKQASLLPARIGFSVQALGGRKMHKSDNFVKKTEKL